MTSIIVVGSLNADMVVRVPHNPAIGETILGGGFETISGGKGANQAVAAARMGVKVRLVGRVGSDSLGDLLCSNLETDQVDTDWVKRDPEAPTGIALIEVSPSGQNSIVVAPGANHNLCPADIQAAENLFENAGMILLQLEIPLETVIYAAQVARAHQVKVLLNPAPAQILPESLLSMVDILVPNEIEAGLLSGISISSLDTAREAARHLHFQGIETVIITLGGRGCILEDSNGSQYFPAFPIQALDTTAAGDAFIAAFSVALEEGQTTKEAISWGQAAGALAASKWGAQPSLPHRSDLLSFLMIQSPSQI